MQKLAKRLSAVMVAVFTLFSVLTVAPVAPVASAAVKPVASIALQPNATYTQGDLLQMKLQAPNYKSRVEYKVVIENLTTKAVTNLFGSANLGYYTKTQPSGLYAFPIHWAFNQAGTYRVFVYVRPANTKIAMSSYTVSSKFTVAAKNDVEAAVAAYEKAPIATAADLANADTLKAAAVAAVATVTDATAKAAFQARIDAMDKKIADAKVLHVDSVSVISNTRVDVALTTAVPVVDKAAFVIKDAAGNALAVSAATLSADGKTVKVTTASQTANTLYTMTVASGNYKFVGLPVDTTKPTVAAAVATKNNKVKVTFSENVDESALNIANYSIAGLSVLSAAYDVDGNGDAVKNVVVLTTAAQTQGTIYKVVVANVTDFAGNVVDSNTNSFQFGGLPADTTKPTVSSAVALSNTSVKVTFSEEMDKTTAQNIANYSIAGLSVLSATLSDDGTYVTLKTSVQTLGTIYKVVVTNVADASANVIDSTLTTNSFQFGGLAADTTKPTVLSAVALTNTSVKVTFSEIMDKATAENPANYAIAGLTVTKAVLDSTSESFVTLTTTPQTLGTIYKVVVTNVADASANVIDSTLTTNSFQFGGLAADTTKPTVVSASSTDSTHVAVVFSEPVDSTTAAQAYNYYLGTDLGYATSVAMDSVITNGTKWVLTTKAQSSKVYTLAVSGVADLSGNVIDSTLASSKTTFAGLAGAGDTTKPQVASAIAIDRNTVKVTFNEAMDPATIAAGDFTFSVYSGTESGTVLAAKTADAISVSSDDKSVTLQFKDTTAIMTSGVVYKVVVANVDDAAGNVIDSTYNYALFAGISTVNAAPTVTSAILVNNATLKITFSEPVEATGAFAGTDFVYTLVTGTPVAGAAFKNAVLSADGTYLTVYYTAPNFTAGSIYTVTVEPTKLTDALGLVDLSNAVVSGTTTANQATFAGISTTATTPKIASAIAVDVNTLDITFDQPVNVLSLVNGDITVTGSAATVAKVRTEGTDGNKVRVFFNGSAPFTIGTVYTVNVNPAHVLNLNGTAMVAADDSALFAAISTANAAPTVASVTKVDATHISVVFTEAITSLQADGSDFAISGLGAVTFTAAMDGTDTTNKTVTLTLSAATTAGIHTLTIDPASTIKDEAGVGGVDTTADVDFVY